MKRIIMVSGKAEHGKTTFAESLRKELPKSVVVNLGDKVKAFCKDYYGWDGKKDKKGRDLLQKIGTDLIEAKGVPFHWVTSVLTDISILAEEFDYIIIADWRFKKEINFILSKLGHDIIFPIRIERDNHVSRLTNQQLKHISEVDLDDFPAMTIENNNDIANLQEDAAWLAKKLMEIDFAEPTEEGFKNIINLGQKVLFQDVIKNEDTEGIERVILIGTVSAIGKEGILVDFDGALKGHSGDMTEFAVGERYPNGKPENDEPNHWFIDYDEMTKVFPI